MIASPGGKNKVEVTLAFTTDASQATAGMNKMTAAAKDLSASAKSAQASMSGMRGPGASGGSASGGSASGGPAFPSTVAGPGGQRFSYEAYTGAQKSIASDARSKEQSAAMSAIKGPDKAFSGGMAGIAASAAVAITAINVLANSIKSLGDVSKGERGKILGVIESVPILGQAVGGMTRAVIGYGEKDLRKGIAQAETNNASYESKQQNRFAGEQKLTGARREGEAAIAGARGFFGGGVVVPVDGEDERVTAAKMEEARAKKAADAAAKDLSAFGKEREQANTGVDVNEKSVRGAKYEEDRVNRESDKYMEDKSGFGGKARTAGKFGLGMVFGGAGVDLKDAAKSSALNGVEQGMNTNKERKDLGRALLTQEEALRTEKDKQLNTTMKQAEYEKARTETMKAQAAVLKDQLATAKAQEKSAGAMSDEDKKELLAAAQEAKEKGLGNVSEERRSMLLSSSLTSGFFGKEAEKLGAMDPTLAQIRGITGEKGSGQLANELKDISAKIDVKIDIDENALAEKMSNIFGKFIKQLEVIVGNQTANSNAQITSDADKAKKMQEASL